MSLLDQVYHRPETRFASPSAKKERIKELKALKAFYKKKGDQESVEMYDAEIKKLS